MDKPKRLRREEPERTGPNRGPSNYYRDSDSWEDQASSSTQTESEGKSPLDSMAEEVTNTVKRAYEILDDSFLQGRKDGEKFRKGVHEKDSNEDTLHPQSPALPSRCGTGSYARSWPHSGQRRRLKKSCVVMPSGGC